MPILDTRDTLKAPHADSDALAGAVHPPMSCMPTPSTLEDVQSLLDAYFCSADCTTSAPAHARATFEIGCDDGDSFYYTPEFEDPNEVRRDPLILL